MLPCVLLAPIVGGVRDLFALAYSCCRGRSACSDIRHISYTSPANSKQCRLVILFFSILGEWWMGSMLLPPGGVAHL